MIRDRTGPIRDTAVWHDAEEFTEAGPSQPYRWQGKDSWELWKDWNTNRSGHAGRKLPPVFVPASQDYDELGRSRAQGYGVDVVEAVAKPAPTGQLADWYRSLATSSRKPTPPEPPDRVVPEVKPSVAISSTLPAAATDVKAEVKPTASNDSATSAPAPIRIHSSEWFIRRALVNTASVSAPATRSSTPSSIGSMLNLNPTSRPPPLPRYAIGPENAGYARLEALGWGGGGLGKPEGEPPKRSRSVEVGPIVDANGVVDLAGDTSESESEEETVHGPGRVVPVATVLKLDRLGLGRGHAQKRVTHTHAEIAAARRRKGTETQKKINWKLREKKERESRKRIAAALNA